MFKKAVIFFSCILLTINCLFSQTTPPRPKLVVGLVVDQMRWDFLYRYYDRYAVDGGFKRLLNQGFTCENTFIPYAPTVTACGHTCVYTASVPAIHGITGNYFWEVKSQKLTYCTQDSIAKTVGSSSSSGKMSPRNLLTTTIGDELRLATNFRSKVIGIALKDRASILPAGHAANAAYWYDSKVGNWISSDYYMQELPKWVSDINDKKPADKFYADGWNTLYPINSYLQSTADAKKYEGTNLGSNTFPYDLKKNIGTNYSAIAFTPFANNMTADFAKAAIINEELGKDNFTDLLAISFSSPDIIGHTFGPNSIEQEDDFLRLDKTFGDLFRFLDKQVGAGQYVVFLSADHGVQQVPEFMKENKLPSGRVYMKPIIKELNNDLLKNFGIDSLVLNDENYQLCLNNFAIDSAGLDKEKIMDRIVKLLLNQKDIANAFPINKLNQVPLASKTREMLNNGYYPTRSGDIQLILKPQYIEGYSETGSSHGLWYPYDAHIPLVWYGWGIRTGKLARETYMTDISATLATLLHIQMPSGCVGHAIPEVIK